ncbi:MAG: methyltransferase domain-containing protein, partial [Armatimonadetes bacterium]|nr:methyltransferase domain-containing protein [Armatimonadota bacterium]
GYHPTTQLCLLALQDLVKAGDVVCDVGTGSAVLAIAAALLGAKRVVGLDNDTVAVEVAQANVAHAGLAGSVVIIRAESPCAFAGKADLVVANIIAKVLIDLATELADVMKPNGLLVACGIVTERCSDVCDAFKSAGISVVDKRFDGDWVALIGKREA